MNETMVSRDVTKPQAELTPRAVAVGLLVAAFVGASYPYIVLKIGFGPTVSVVAAFFAFIGLNIVAKVGALFTKRSHPSNRYEYNIVQTAGTASAQTAFMCVVLAAFDMLASKPELGFNISPTPMQVFIWMSLAGCLGVLLAVPMRKHYIDEENLTFADGTAAGESLMILDDGTTRAQGRVKVLAAGGLLAATATWFRDGAPQLIKEAVFFSPAFAKLRVGMSLSLLNFGSGMIVGLRITLSMALGSAVAWFILPSLLVERGFIPEAGFKETLKWVMWPATGLMVSSGLTSLFLKWKAIKRTFEDMASGSLTKDSTDFPMKWVVTGSVVLSIALILFQWVSMGVAIWESALAIAISVVLMLVGIRVLGETNWAPISAMANMVQAVFALLSPGSIATNMVASGMSGTVAGSGETLMQDFRAGKIIGSNNRLLTYMQLLGTPVGAAAIAIVYPLLRRTYGIGPDRFGLDPSLAAHEGSGLTSPISMKWSGFAELLMGGLDKLPAGTMMALGVGVAFGIVITVFEERFKNYLPSPTGAALGMLIPAMEVIPMLIGGLVQFVWSRLNPRQEDEYTTPLASGLIVGEALLALVIPIIRFAGLLPPPAE